MASETVAANKAYFNELAASYDARFGKTIDELIEHIRSRKDLIGAAWLEDNDEDGAEGASGAAKRDVRLLDYACGTGLVSRALAEFTTQCVGVDISEGMVGAYNAKAENQGLSADEMHAVQGNLTDPDDAEPAALASLPAFDVAAVGLGFHHFDDPELAAARLVARLKPGGVLFIVDFMTHEPASSGGAAANAVKHHGFSRERMRDIFVAAGAGAAFAMEELGSGIVFQAHGGHEAMRRHVFIARGTKA